MLEYITGEVILLLSSIEHYPIPEYGGEISVDGIKALSTRSHSRRRLSLCCQVVQEMSKLVLKRTKGEVLYGDDAAVNENGP